MYKIGDKVETVNGIGVIEDVRLRADGSVDYLVCTGPTDHFGGNRDVYGEDEVVTTSLH